MMGKRRIRFVLLACIALVGSSWAQEIDAIDEARIDAATRAAFPRASADWLARFKADQTLEACSRYRDAPPAEMALTIAARESATIQYPPDGKLIGDWKRGEQMAQSGYGSLYRLSGDTREWRQLLRLSPAHERRGELRHNWPEPCGLRQNPEVFRSRHEGSL